jgi:hypothetical protein
MCSEAMESIQHPAAVGYTAESLGENVWIAAIRVSVMALCDRYEGRSFSWVRGRGGCSAY